MFEEERSVLIPVHAPFDGFCATTASVSKTCLVRFDRNKYSVMARAVGRPVEIYAYADRIVIRQDGEVVGAHTRSFGRGRTVYDPWHYVPILARKPGALRNGAPFKDWELPKAIARVRSRLSARKDGDRQMVEILTAVLTDGIEAVETACIEALKEGAVSAIGNILTRQTRPAVPENIATSANLALTHEPLADCGRYDHLRERFRRPEVAHATS